MRQRLSERTEKAPCGVRTSATALGFDKKPLQILRSKTATDVSSAFPMLEELVRKRGKKYEIGLKLQRLYDVLSNPIEQQVVIEDSVGNLRVTETKNKQLNK